jgi:hypothetical protein
MRLALLVLLSGCFAEVTGSYLPDASHTHHPVLGAETETESNTAMIALSVGAYLDAYGVGAHLGYTRQSADDLTTAGPSARLDFDLPKRSTKLDLRLTAAYTLVLGDASGSTGFLGVTAGAFDRIVQLSLGYTRFGFTITPNEVRAGDAVFGYGPQARLLVHVLPWQLICRHVGCGRLPRS